MSGGDILFLAIALGAFTALALVLGYESFAEWRHLRTRRRERAVKSAA
ncbi:MAG TPA: hypothetical protein VG819_13785 [Rhizomicrobium sp.]|jgi:hypothetical protein|nr:hypothetical protein [Rhizomicrobium sp.]